MNKPNSKDHSIKAEPCYDTPHDSPDAIDDEPALTGRAGSLSEIEQVEQGVWDEPSFVASQQAVPESVVTYAKWYKNNVEKTSWAKSWGWTIIAVVLGGPIAIICTVLAGDGGGLAVVVFGPLAEEILKAVSVALILERRPYLIRSPLQIIIAVLASAFVFAYIENIVYLNVYIAEPSAEIIWWRHYICTLLHMSASLLAAIGLLKVWRQSRVDFSKPKLELSYPWVIAAVVLHGSYNFVVTVFEFALPF